MANYFLTGDELRFHFLDHTFRGAVEQSEIDRENAQPVLELTADLLYIAHAAGKVKTFNIQALSRLDGTLNALCRGESLHDLEHQMEWVATTMAIDSILTPIRLDYWLWTMGKYPKAEIKRTRRLVGGKEMPVSMRRLARDDDRWNDNSYKKLQTHFEEFSAKLLNK